MDKKKITKQRFNPLQNYKKTRKEIGYVSRKDATIDDYKRIGFKSGLEVHQQLKTKEKLFCRCPAGIYNDNDDYDAEIIRHMRPTLSELGEYDGTALMEFKTKKEIFYRINNETTCTYDVDDTPPFKINNEALEIAIEISLLSKLNIVGEVHITRKQYLDGSIPTGFQRTAIIGVEGEIQLKNKKVGLIQLSIEEDSCREISDIGHIRIYKTDRLGMPLIETVTHPHMETPDELKEAAEYIRFLNRSTGKVRTGIGSGREDVNVSCRGGTRVEIKGVSRNKSLPELSHNEAFRQYALLNIREKLKKKVNNNNNWKIKYKEIDFHDFDFQYKPIIEAKENDYKLLAINLPNFKGILSHFTQPEKIFADEITDRLKVIACIEKPNMLHSEEFETKIKKKELDKIQDILNSGDDDAQLLIWGPENDIPTALETVEERCKMAFDGVPNETRKSFLDGTTIFERVLPGADRMYPDTDSPPIPIDEKDIEKLGENLPIDISDRYNQLKNWNIPEDTYNYILRNNLVPVIERIINELDIEPKFTGTFFGHNLKHVEGQLEAHADFTFNKVYGIFKYVVNNNLDVEICKLMLPIIYEHPNMIFESVLTSIKFKRKTKEQLFAPVDYLIEKFKEIRRKKSEEITINWIMGQLNNQAIGNISLKELKIHVENRVKKLNTN
ncbi:MAG: Glu-tRNA(Gln) amidotransferase subunit GatE [Bacteroidales bacterium]|nr:Glu-tRNA(Gln) amidotransferase subunit GatE [Bacteroidales bacterium]